MFKTSLSVNNGAIHIAKNPDVSWARSGFWIFMQVSLVEPTFVPAAAIVKVGSKQSFAASCPNDGFKGAVFAPDGGWTESGCRPQVF